MAAPADVSFTVSAHQGITARIHPGSWWPTASAALFDAGFQRGDTEADRELFVLPRTVPLHEAFIHAHTAIKNLRAAGLSARCHQPFLGPKVTHPAAADAARALFELRNTLEHIWHPRELIDILADLVAADGPLHGLRSWFDDAVVWSAEEGHLGSVQTADLQDLADDLRSVIDGVERLIASVHDHVINASPSPAHGRMPGARPAPPAVRPLVGGATDRNLAR
ncbi:hypothetical protein [Streptomyces sp. NPDC127098]|uniref:hypothetical protein n=1 Tax=Streptomyces sp. NPDC127098 TaxID=3347137 RepID=UPI003659B20D